MRHAIALIVLLAAAPLLAQSRPNLILIIGDDLGCDDTGPYGNAAVRTPNMDRLARGGLRFDRAFLTCSSCSPSRASIITGRYPHSTGAAELHMPVPKDQVTFVEKLKAAGYWTAQAGKWHLGPALKDRFDVLNEGDRAVDGVPADGSGCTRWLPTLRQRPKDKPFFLWLAAFDPHRDYKPGAFDPPHKAAEVIVPPYLADTPATRADLALYYDEIARFDSYVGKVLEELEKEGLADNTIVMLIGDNGRPFPRCKTTVYDSGIRTPLLVRWPAKVKPGTTSLGLVSSVDLAPTFLDLAGLRTEPTFQGVSFARLLSEPTATVRPHIFSEHNWHDYQAHERAVRTERWKYIRNSFPQLTGSPPADAVRSASHQELRRLRDAGKLTPQQSLLFAAPRPAEELYDTQADPHELVNLAGDAKHAEELARLRAALDAWIKETGDKAPEKPTPDKFDRETGKAVKP